MTLEQAFKKGEIFGFRMAADIAYLAVIRASDVPRRTQTLKLPRSTYPHEFASAAKTALRAEADKLEKEE